MSRTKKLDDAERQELEDWRAVAANLEQREDYIGDLLEQIELAQGDAESERRHTRYLYDRFGGLEKALAKAKAEIKTLKAEPAAVSQAARHRDTILERVRRPVSSKGEVPAPVQAEPSILAVESRVKSVESNLKNVDSKLNDHSKRIEDNRTEMYEIQKWVIEMFRLNSDRFSDHTARANRGGESGNVVEFRNFRKMRDEMREKMES